jgi:GT2 family glycosyltransferase
VTGSLTRSTIVVVTWRGKGHVSACLDAVAAQTRPHRLLVIDNASDDGTAEVLARHPSSPSVLRLPVNVGYAGALAAATVETEFTAWLNDDAEPAPDWLASLEDALDQREDAAAAGSRMVALDGSVISVGVGLTAAGYGVDLVSEDPPAFGFCGGAALVRTDTLRQVGGVPARFFCYYEDTDTAWRLRLAGHTIVSVPEARVVHRHGASTRPGSRQFHLWNERNRLAMLIRCAPAAVAAKELARFAVITALLPLRQARDRLRSAPAPVDNSPLAGQNRRWPRVAWKSGVPLGHERDSRSGSGDQSGSGHPEQGKPSVPPGSVETGGPPEHQWDSRSGPSDQSGSGHPEQGKLSVPSDSVETGGPPAHERDSRSESVGESVASRRSRGGARRWSPVAWVRGPEASGRAVPWNFRLGLRLQVLRELAVTFGPLLRERRTVTRLANVPRSAVWRGGRSTNSPS